MEREIQRAKIIAYCKEHGSITNMEATTQLHIGSASKRISDIRLSGNYKVSQEDVKVLDENGKQRTHYYRYRIEEIRQ